MGVVAKLTELSKVKLTVMDVPSQKAKNSTSPRPELELSVSNGLTAEQLIAELQRQKRSAS